MQIELTFLDSFQDAILTGKQTATSRTRKHGNIGDTFEAFGSLFVITAVNRLTVAHVAQVFWRQEGCTGPEGFLAVWARLHPRNGWQLHQLIYFHQFVKTFQPRLIN